MPGTDFELVFDLAPVGLFVLRDRIFQRCNETFETMFGYGPQALVGASISVLYPSNEEFEHIGARGMQTMSDTGVYSDERIMKHRDGHLFWCHVSGRSLDRARPFECTVWMFEDMSAHRPVTAPLTPRERQIAQLLVAGKSTKHIARELSISPRTIDAHRGRLMRKLKVTSPTEMVTRLAGIS
jgi:PAS domain S-box-containing protein